MVLFLLEPPLTQSDPWGHTMLVKRRGFQLWLLQMWVDIMKRRGLTITFILHEIVHYYKVPVECPDPTIWKLKNLQFLCDEQKIHVLRVTGITLEQLWCQHLANGRPHLALVQPKVNCLSWSSPALCSHPICVRCAIQFSNLQLVINRDDVEVKHDDRFEYTMSSPKCGPLNQCRAHADQICSSWLVWNHWSPDT